MFEMGTTSMRRSLAWATACLILHAGSVWAHPGHGSTDPDGPAHYALEPLHMLPILLPALAMAGIWGVSRIRRRAAVRRERRS
jgi:hypothetical protein